MKATEDDILKLLLEKFTGDDRTLPPPTNPMATARELLREQHQEHGVLTLRHWRGSWMLWQTTCWAEVEHRLVREAAYRFTEHALYAEGEKLKPWQPNRHKIADLLEAMGAAAFLAETVKQPSWINDVEGPRGPIVSCDNGLLAVETRELLPHTPSFFNLTAVPFAYDPDAPAPARWHGFLADVFPEDEASSDALGEFFGYVVSGRLDLQKILIWVGPTRGGKGATARLLSALIGRDNVCGPTLSSLGNDFGLAPLLGKPLAVVSDARLSGHNGTAVVERLLNISGEDVITVNRKYKDQWSGKLPCRFFLISNELPHFGDASGAIVGRFVILQSQHSWLGREDPDLERELHAELPGILNWTLDGLTRLTLNGRFTEPSAAAEAVRAMIDLASPVGAFVRDRCLRDLGAEVPCDGLWHAWKEWAEANGHRPGTTQRFGRDLRAVVPTVRVSQPRVGDERYRVFRGIHLRTSQ